ncbi:MAG: hypothetical protein QXH07_04960 [Thermoplasmata archaeon]
MARKHRHHRYNYQVSAQYGNIQQAQRNQTVSSMLKVALPKLLIKSVIMTVVLFILTLPSIKLFNVISGIGLSTAFSSLMFLGSFIIMFVLFSVYDFATSHRVWAVENVIAVLLVFMLLVSLEFSTLLVLAAFLLIVIGLIIGALLRQLSSKHRGMTKVVGGSIAFLFIIWAIYVVLANSNYYTPPTGASINLNKPYLTQQQLNVIYGSGTYSESALDAGELPIGSLDLLFPTPIQTLLFNFTFQDTNAGQSYYITYYNRTYATNFTELVVETPQASIILANEAPHAQQSGSVGNLQYIEDLTVNPNSFTSLVQQSNFLAIVSCAGSLCTQQTFNTILQKIEIGIS